MLDKYLLSKKEIGKFKLTLKNPLALNCEKITQNPRVFNTLQIKNAIENISFVDIEERIFPNILVKAIDFILKEFFLQMHQTGLYNRQFNLWSTLANISQIIIYKIQKGLFKKKDLNIFLIDFLIDIKQPCIRTIVINYDCRDVPLGRLYNDFTTYLSKALEWNNKHRLKGIFYFAEYAADNYFLQRLIELTNSYDLITKYESKIKNTRDARLNIINYKKENENYIFEHIYPQLKTTSEVETLRRSVSTEKQ